MTTSKPKPSIFDVDEIYQDLLSGFDLIKSVHSFILIDVTSQVLMMEQGIDTPDDLLSGKHPKLLKTIITRWNEALTLKFQSMNLSDKCKNLGIRI